MDTFQCSILLNERPMCYFLPGDHVSGTVTITTSAPIKAHFLRIKWKGEAKTNFPGNSVPKSHIYFNGYTAPWVSNNEQSTFPAGPNVYGFAFVLPRDCPPTYSEFIGSITYYVEVELFCLNQTNYRKSLKFNVGTKNYLVVNGPDMFYPAKFRNFRFVGANIDDGIVSLQLCLPQCVFAQGDEIKAEIFVANSSPNTVVHMKTELIRKVHFHRHPYQIPCYHSLKTLSSLSKKIDNCVMAKCDRRNFEFVVNKEGQDENMPPSRDIYRRTVSFYLAAEDVFPNFDSSMISVGYILRVAIVTSDFSTLITTGQIAIGYTNLLSYNEEMIKIREINMIDDVVRSRMPRIRQPATSPFRDPPAPKVYVEQQPDRKKQKAHRRNIGKLIDSRFNKI